MQLGLVLLLLAIIAITAFLVSRIAVGVVNAAFTPVANPQPAPGTTPVGSGLTPDQIYELNAKFQEKGCPSFDAATLQLELNKVPSGKIIFNLSKLANATREQINTFVIDNRRRFPFFADYCDGRQTAKQFTQNLQGWIINPLGRKALHL